MAKYNTTQIFVRRVVILDMSQKFRLFKAEMGQHENPEICFVELDVDGIQCFILVPKCDNLFLFYTVEN